MYLWEWNIAITYWTIKNLVFICCYVCLSLSLLTINSKFSSNMGEKSIYIHSFSVDNMWNRVKLVWNDIRPNVNIIVGINGSGKTTLLNCINDYYNSKKSLYKCNGTPLGIPVQFIRSFDVPLANRKKKDSPLYQELEKSYFSLPIISSIFLITGWGLSIIRKRGNE